MDAISEQAVREHAYALWIEAGMVHGLDRAHWLAAEMAMKRVAQPTASIKSSAVKSAAAKATTKAVATKPVTAKKSSQTAASVAPAKVSKGGSKVAGNVAGKPGVSMKASSAAPSHLAN